MGALELIIVLGLFVLFFGAKKLPELAKGLAKGFEEFREAARVVAGELADQLDGEGSEEDVQPDHFLLMAATVILGAACVILVLYEFCK